ncbi:TetR/AcrR family transcriptional regulator C-terminal domain-containing protein [Actinopolymorpha pittospori]|uniref:AcrR family transcriptional regulator n=1 Tax=Actinopolymorpha pittospori TaxID=648752 RepID=A0A927R8F4_9ACTN|nr:TetR/AcrR family transcriptional regulator C-terminal domain-containing protein [Actinopolymorpha pittospori]MBE1606662.1 AcrR family transcriptional regulator [Actinopolymorpha pittospori]
MSESGPPDATGGRGETSRSGDQGTPGRGTLSRETIVVAAIDFVDRYGLPILTMRRLGEYLGVEAMSLYRYVNGREDLLEGIVRRMVDDLHVDARRRELLAGNGWQAYLQWLAHAVRRLARQHPQLFPLIATRHPAAPWLRPPLRSLEVVEDFLATLTDRGFSVENAVTAYRTFTSYLLGYLLLEVATLSGRALTTEEPINEGGADVPNTQEVSLDGFPHIQRMEPLLSQDHTDAEFEQSLEDLLDRLDRLVSR